MFDTDCMGGNKRYAGALDRIAEEKHLAALASQGGLQSLSERELGLDQQPLTIDPDPKPVLAWVRFFDRPVRVKAWAERWTPVAVGIRFQAGQRVLKCWVWSSAVESDDSPRPIPDAKKYGP